MTTTKLNFIKKPFADIQAACAATTGTGAGNIVFDKKNHVICVDGEVYGGKVRDVQFAAKTNVDTGDQTSVLTIYYGDGTTKEVDFSDMASAKATLRVFEQIMNKIGDDGASHTIDYTGTNYLGTPAGGSDPVADNLKDADKELDRKVKQIKDQIGNATDDVNTVDYGTDRYLGTKGGTIATPQATTLHDADIKLSEAISALDDATATYEVRKIADTDRTDAPKDGIAAQYGLFKVTHTYDKVTGKTTENVQEVTGTNTSRINIPKDFLVKEVRMLTVAAATDDAKGEISAADITAHGGTGTFSIGDKILEFVVNTKVDEPSTDIEDNTYIYINVNDLFDSYTGDTALVRKDTDASTAEDTPADVTGNEDTTWGDRTGKVSINVDQTNNKISGTLAPGAVTGKQINKNVVTTDEGENLKATDETKRLAGEVKVNGQQVTLGTIKTYNPATDQVSERHINARVSLYWAEWSDQA